RFEPGNKFSRGLRWQCILSENPERGGGEKRDWLKVLGDIEVERVDRGRADIARPVADYDGVAVPAAVGDTTSCNRTTGTADRFDNYALAKRTLHRFAQDACQRVGRAAGWKSHKHRDRARRISLCPSNPRCDRQHGGGCGQMQELATGKFHG